MKRNSTPRPSAGKASAAADKIHVLPVLAAAETPDVSVSAVLARIQTLSSSLGPVGQRIADFIVKNAREVVHMSVS